MVAKKVIKGVAKKYSASESGPRGYRPVWDTGQAAYNKRVTKITGINRPSV